MFSRFFTLEKVVNVNFFFRFWPKMTLLMRTGGVTKIILCADHFYNKIIACFCAILRIYAPSLEGSKDAFRHELIVFQTSKLAEKAPIQRASCLGSRQDSDCTKNSHFQKMHEPLAGFCRPSFGKFPLKECASFQSIPFRIIQGKSGVMGPHPIL